MEHVAPSIESSAPAGDGPPAKAATPPPTTGNDATEKPKAEASTKSVKLRVVALTAAFLGIVFGGTVEYFVGGALDSTGWFGPTLDHVVAEQQANFEDIRTKLAELAKAPPGSPEAIQLQKEISSLVATQEKLTGRTHEEIVSLQEEVTKLRAQMLQERGSAGGADFWLLTKEAITLREEGNIFSLIAVHYNGGAVDVNFNGKSSRLRPGDYVEFETKDSTCRVFYKTGIARSDGRFGFDLVCQPKA